MIIEDEAPKIIYDYSKSKVEEKEKEKEDINKPYQDSVPKKKAYEYKKDEFSTNIKVIDSKNINILKPKEENKEINKISNKMDKIEKEEAKTSWGFGIKNKYR